MAKKKTDDIEHPDVDNTASPEETPETIQPAGAPVSSPIMKTGAGLDDANGADPPPVTPQPTPEPEEKQLPQQMNRTLQVNYRYPSLYLDINGGAYTPNTPAHIRKDAKLYDNPYYES